MVDPEIVMENIKKKLDPMSKEELIEYLKSLGFKFEEDENNK